MTREEQIRQASIDYQLSTNPRAIGGDAFADMAREMNVNPSFIAGVKWAEKEFANKVQKYSITYKYDLNVAIKAYVGKEMIHDRLLIRLIERLKRDGFIEIKETQEDDISTIFMCVNVLKNNFKQAMEE
jgi:hypothetical protein